MALWATDAKLVKGSLAFLVWWLLAVFPAFPLLPIGRTAGSLLGASLMVLLGVISSDAAFAAVDLPILGLLFATMVLSVYLERARAFDTLSLLLSWKTRGGKDLLVRVCVLAALSSALFTNDSTCVVLTGFVLKLCQEKRLHPKPFLIALACSANIGSAATPIGNPQNLVIAVQGRLGFWSFVAGVLPAVVVGMACNILGLLLIYGGSLSMTSLEEEEVAVGNGDEVFASSKRSFSVGSQGGDEEWEGSRALLNNSCSFNLEACGDEGIRGREVGWMAYLQKRKTGVWKLGLFLLMVGIWILGATMHTFEAGVGLPWTAITAAVMLTVVDFSDATETLDKVSYSILVFFSGMFITVEGFNSTGAPERFWSAVEPYSRIDTQRGKVVLSLVVTFLSNVASNVPTVLLLGPRVAASAIATTEQNPIKRG